MQNDEQRQFILTPIVNILQDTVNACKGIGQGIETQSLGEYVLQTTFLKMTGAQEQKLKGICWEMATDDYDYRYQYLKKNYGECSSYSDKSCVYRDLLAKLIKLDKGFSVAKLFDDVDVMPKLDLVIAQKVGEAQKNQERKKGRPLTDEEKEKMEAGMRKYYTSNGLCEKEQEAFSRRVLFLNVQEMIDRIVGKSLVAQWEEHNYLNYMTLWKGLSKWSFATGDLLMCKELQEFYSTVVYEHRNKCAHNLLSLQKNLPTLKTLEEEEFVYDNYYFRFSVLVLLDEIFVRLYRAYLLAMARYKVAIV